MAAEAPSRESALSVVDVVLIVVIPCLLVTSSGVMAPAPLPLLDDQSQQRLLRVEPVLCLIPHRRALVVEQLSVVG